MKKMVNFAVVALALCGILVSCASGGSSKSTSDKAAPASVHPRTYVVDLADAMDGNKVSIAFNQYGPNYQSTPNMNYTKFIKLDKPQAGDTVVLNWKFTADKDLPVLLLGLVDGSAQANYWTNLLDPSVFVMAENVKAGEVVEGSKEVVLSKSVLGKFEIYIQYDSDDSVKMGYEKCNDSSTLTFMDVEGVDTTDVEKEDPSLTANLPTGPRTFDVNLADIAKMLTIPVNASDGQIWNFQYIGSITDAFNIDALPAAGDTIHVYFKGKSDVTIETPVIMTIVENTAAVGWWKDLVATDDSKWQTFAEAGSIVAGEEFLGEATFVLSEGATEGLSIQMFYDVFDGATGATWLYSKN